MFADARGAGVLGMPTVGNFRKCEETKSSFFVSIFPPIPIFVLSLHTTIVGNKQQDEKFSEGVFSQYVSSHHISLVDLYYETNTINNRSSGKYSRLS